MPRKINYYFDEKNSLDDILNDLIYECYKEEVNIE